MLTMQQIIQLVFLMLHLIKTTYINTVLIEKASLGLLKTTDRYEQVIYFSFIPFSASLHISCT